jgi:hypothetical protein
VISRRIQKDFQRVVLSKSGWHLQNNQVVQPLTSICHCTRDLSQVYVDVMCIVTAVEP